MSDNSDQNIFDRAESYDRQIDWSARMGRELPLLKDAFGPPGEGRLLDAGCGTGRHVVALGTAGYRVVGADKSRDMIRVAERNCAAAGVDAPLHPYVFEELRERLEGVFDGIYCLGNSLAASGSAAAVREALENFGAVLQPGGKLVVQVLNFPLLRKEEPVVRGPRVVEFDGVEHVTSRVFTFQPEGCVVASVTVWKDSGGWQQRVSRGCLYPVELAELQEWTHRAGLRIAARYGDYSGAGFDPDESRDLIFVAERE